MLGFTNLSRRLQNGGETGKVAVLALAMMIMFLNGCSELRIHRYINRITESQQEDLTRKQIFSVFNNGKNSIHLLVEKISELRFWGLPLKHPRNSIELEPQNSIGFAYAYLIELILGRQKLELDKNADYMFGAEKNYVYWDGRIVLRGGEGLKTVGMGDLREIYWIYRQWWNENQKKTLRRLRKEWKRGIRPLSGSKYSWK